MYQRQEQIMNTSVIRPLLACCAVVGATLASACSYKPTEVHHHDPEPTTTVTYSPGYVVQSLPSGYTTTSVGGTSYYTYDGVFYRPHDSGYIVVETP
jgi:hypothetical protein